MRDRIFLGLGGIVDIEVHLDQGAIQSVVDELGIDWPEVYTVSAIRNKKDLVCVLVRQMNRGEGGEFYVDNPAAIRWAEQRFEHRTTLGGTNLRAAAVLSHHGIPTIAHVSAMDDTMAALAPHGCELVAAESVDQLIPHLIMQYSPGTKVRIGGTEFVTNRANRVILANDPPNERMKFSSRLCGLIDECPVILISTLNAIQDELILEQRVKELETCMHQRNPNSIAIWEDAGYHQPDFQRPVAMRMAGIVDVFSTNEEEASSLIGRQVDWADSADVEATLRDLRDLLNVSTVVVHTAAWSAAYGDRVEKLSSALNYANIVATARYIWGDEVGLEKYAEASRLPQEPVGVALAARLNGESSRMMIVPGRRAQTMVPTTVGLGDAFLGGLLSCLSVHPEEEGQ